MVATRINEVPMLELTATTARTSGAVVLYNTDTYGIVADTVANGARYNAFVTGTWELAKNTGLTFTAGEDVYWDGSELTTVQSSNTRIGVVARTAITTASKGRILLNHPNVQLVAQT
jgi:predicted RecA/RadA family phage recombinase